VKLLKLLCLLFVVGLTSCGTAKYASVPVSVSFPAKLALTQDSTHVLIINRLAYDSARINKKKLAVLRAGAYSATMAAENELKQLKGVRVTNLVDSVPFTANTDSIKQLAATHNATYILTLDNFTVDIVLDQIDGSGDERTAYYNTKAQVNFTLYESNGLYFKKLKGLADDPQSEGPYGGFLGELLFSPGIKGNKFAVNSAAHNATLDALKDYLPYAVTNNRPLYNQGDLLQSAVKQIQSGRFDRAYEILNPLIDSADVQLASKAAYNLAVVYEAQGDIKAALDLARQSNQKEDNVFAGVLITALLKE
jgi:hypothetical protein